MKTEKSRNAISPQDKLSQGEYWVTQMPNILHALSNKLLPIVAFSDLGARRCDDPELQKYFDKIRQAAEDSRELIIQLRCQFHQRDKDLSSIYPSKKDNAKVK